MVALIARIIKYLLIYKSHFDLSRFLHHTMIDRISIRIWFLNWHFTVQNIWYSCWIRILTWWTISPIAIIILIRNIWIVQFFLNWWLNWIQKIRCFRSIFKIILKRKIRCTSDLSNNRCIFPTTHSSNIYIWGSRCDALCI